VQRLDSMSLLSFLSQCGFHTVEGDTLYLLAVYATHLKTLPAGSSEMSQSLYYILITEQGNPHTQRRVVRKNNFFDYAVF